VLGSVLGSVSVLVSVSVWGSVLVLVSVSVSVWGLASASVLAHLPSQRH